MCKNNTIADHADLLLHYINERDTAFFLGSGISRDSGIPTVREFIDLLQERTGFSCCVSRDLLSRIQFESLVSEIVATTCKDRFADLFSGEFPNDAHAVMGRLCKIGRAKYFITTNFDELLETQFRHESINPKVITNIDELDQAHFDDTESATIFKLHGSAAQWNTIATTLEDVSNSCSRDFSARVFEYLIKDRGINIFLFFGYSFSDRFDVNPALHNIAPQSHFIVWTHATDSCVGNPGLNHPDIKEICGSYLELYGDTRILWNELGKHIEHFPQRKNLAPRARVNRWWDGLSRSERLSLKAILQGSVGCHSKAAESAIKAFVAAYKNQEQGRIASTAASLGWAAHLAGRETLSTQIFNLAINVSDIEQNPIPILFSRIKLTIIYLAHGKHEKALKELFNCYANLCEAVHGAAILSELYSCYDDKYAIYWAEMYSLLGTASEMDGEKEKSIGFYQEAINISSNKGYALIEIKSRAEMMTELIGQVLNGRIQKKDVMAELLTGIQRLKFLAEAPIIVDQSIKARLKSKIEFFDMFIRHYHNIEPTGDGLAE